MFSPTGKFYEWNRNPVELCEEVHVRGMLELAYIGLRKPIVKIFWNFVS